MKSIKWLLVAVLMFVFTSVSFAEEAKKPVVPPPAPVAVTLTRVQELEKQLKDLQDQYAKILNIKSQAELQIAQTAGALQEAKRNEDPTKKS